MKKKYRQLMISAVIGVVVLVFVAPAEAQHGFQPLFDKFNLRLEGSWLALNSEIRLDSETLGVGTTLSFEDDLGLSSSKAVPSIAFEWQVARKHRLGVRWQKINRDSSAQALTEIQWGDDVIPVEAAISLAFDTTQYFVDYTYYPWVRDEWAAGFGLGLRMMDLDVTLQWEDNILGETGDEIDGSAPLPYLYFEYRRLLSERWRLVTGLGWLYIEIGDIKGGQWLVKGSIEYLLGERWSFGAGLNLANADVDWTDLKDEEGNPELTGHIDLGINDVSVFARIRF